MNTILNERTNDSDLRLILFFIDYNWASADLIANEINPCFNVLKYHNNDD